VQFTSATANLTSGAVLDSTALLKLDTSPAVVSATASSIDLEFTYSVTTTAGVASFTASDVTIGEKVTLGSVIDLRRGHLLAARKSFGPLRRTHMAAERRHA
jgi:hypothetical protein